ncbi:G-type lectin S-receptor-like serine/threonine-protein kinase At1g34300 [Cajanus cajan]|uniref:G-type lectin S-receptor-like serine/threonine-protein kinase At1g34300 n=1 Tax=Cajanus cajan TaxID=3821 RepID=UPI00098D87F3|nr:G-type lectin S-receptor-like serine/threonine-protein kinase At1g34300 [Cajanus cajan]
MPFGLWQAWEPQCLLTCCLYVKHELGHTKCVGPQVVLFMGLALGMVSLIGHHPKVMQGCLCVVLRSFVWNSGTAGRGATSATLEESGNLVIWKGTGTLWSSFDHPTDTLLPSQNFTVGKSLTSQSYSFSLLANGNLILKWNNSIVYWNHQGFNSYVNASLDSPVLALSSIGFLQLSDVNLSTPVVIAYSSDYVEGNSDVLRVLKLDNDGNLRIYSTNKGSGSSNVRWTAIQDQCEVYAYCGNYGVCSYNDSSPVCGCPSENFDMVDRNDARKGCRRKVSLDSCQGSATMLTLDNAVILSYAPEAASQLFFIGISACRGNCLSSTGDCYASTSLSDGSGQCLLISKDFVSFYHNLSMPSISYVKVCPPLAPNPLQALNPPPSLGETGMEKRSKLRAWVVVVVVLGAILGLIALQGCLWVWFCRNRLRFGGLSSHDTLFEYASGAPMQFLYKELQKATKGFKKKLGAGGFGAVYRGTLVNKTVVAVKQLEGIEQGEKQFRMEVATIGSTHHLNLVRLIGFCSEGRHRLLVFEFLKNVVMVGGRNNCAIDDALQAMAQTLGTINQLLEIDWLKRFQQKNSLSFCGGYNSDRDVGWIFKVEKIFQALGCPLVQKVTLAAFMLSERLEFCCRVPCRG